MVSFAVTWIANWNQCDVEVMLRRFADEAEFVRPITRDVVGEAVLPCRAEPPGTQARPY
jgi:hypothetical protein